MTKRENAEKYIALCGRTYAAIVDTLGDAARGRLSYWESLIEIAVRPHSSPALETVVQENFGRANEVATLTVDELRARGQRAVRFSKDMLAALNEAQELGVAAVREAVGAYLSNVEQAPTFVNSFASNGSKSRETASSAN